MSVKLKTEKAELVLALEQMSEASATLLVPVIADLAAHKGVEAVFLTRALRALIGLAKGANVSGAAAAPSDYDLFLTVLQQPEAIALLPSQDPLAKAKIRGLLAKPKLLEAENGSVSAEEAAQMLGITRQAVDKRRKQGKLIALPAGRSHRYPAWQFADGKTLPGLESVLKALSVRDPWMQAAWMLNGNFGLEGDRPLDRLRAGKMDAVLAAAALYGEQGAI
jgi:hypothetical protein